MRPKKSICLILKIMAGENIPGWCTNKWEIKRQTLNPIVKKLNLNPADPDSAEADVIMHHRHYLTDKLYERLRVST